MQHCTKWLIDGNVCLRLHSQIPYWLLAGKFCLSIVSCYRLHINTSVLTALEDFAISLWLPGSPVAFP